MSTVGSRAIIAAKEIAEVLVKHDLPVSALDGIFDHVRSCAMINSRIISAQERKEADA